MDGDPDLTIGDYDGTFSYYENRLMVVGEDEESISADHMQLSLYPNPVKEELNIELTISTSENVRIEIFQINGVKVFQKDFTQITAGKHMLLWEAGDVSNGMYFLRIKTDSEILAQKILKQ